MRPSRSRALTALTLAAALVIPSVASTAADRPRQDPTPAGRPSHGDPDWVETHTTASERLAPGVELLTISWGAAGPDDRWTVLVHLPADPDGPLSSGSTALGPRDTAERAATALREAGFAPFVAAVDVPEFADSPAAELGWTVKVGSFDTAAQAREALTRLRAAGFAGSTRFTAQDGADQGAPQTAYVVRVDFDEFDGDLVADHGEALNGGERISDTVTRTEAVAGINAQWFYDNAPAGLYVRDGRLVGSATQGRGGVLVRDGGRRVDVDAFTAHVRLAAGRDTVEVDGVNRIPGKVTNCGGVGGDTPTEAPQHDLVCTDDSELVKFTPEFGTTPTGEGAEAVLDGRGKVLAVHRQRGAAVPEGGTTVQAIGASADWLTGHLRVGQVVRWHERVEDSRGRKVALTPDTTILQVGPTLVDDGRVAVNARADGLFREGADQTFTYNWVLRANPRSAVGTDDQGRLLLSVVDGRQAGYSEGLSIADHALFLQRLGAVEALNLDGGGSSSLATADGVVNRPSDATGLRYLGNALLLRP